MSPIAEPEATIFSAYDRYRSKKKGGSGRMVRMRVPGDSPRSRIYIPPKGWPRVWHRGQRLSGLKINNIIKARYVKANRDARRHVNSWLRYVQDRERGPEEKERKFFDRERGNIERDEVREDLLAKQGKDIACYKILLSPKQNELDHESYTREIMTRWEEVTGIKTDWYAIKHENTDHHHIHLMMPGLDVDGNPYRLDRDHLNIMREIANEYQYEIQDRAYQYEKSIDYELGVGRDQMEKYAERRQGEDLMRELGVTSKELDDAIKDLIPPGYFDDVEFRKSLEDRPVLPERADKIESDRNDIVSNDMSKNADADYLSPMDWSEHFAAEDASEAIDRQAEVTQDREQDDRDFGDFL